MKKAITQNESFFNPYIQQEIFDLIEGIYFNDFVKESEENDQEKVTGDDNNNNDGEKNESDQKLEEPKAVANVAEYELKVNKISESF